MGMQDGVVQLSELNGENIRPEKGLFQLVNLLKEITILKFIDINPKVLSFDKIGLLTIWHVHRIIFFTKKAYKIRLHHRKL